MLTFLSRRAIRLASAVVMTTALLGAAAEHAAAAPPSDTGSAAITFTGFDEAPDGTSHLYVKLTRPVAVEERSLGTHFEYRLVGTTIPLRNNKNPLITTHFGTQVVSAQLMLASAPKHGKAKRKKHAKARAAMEAPPEDGARLVVQTREVVKPQHRVVQNADGSATFVVTFPKPSKPPPPEADVIAPPPQSAP